MEESGISTESGTPVAEKTVSLHEATADDLDAFLAKDDAEIQEEPEESQPDEDLSKGEETTSSVEQTAAPAKQAQVTGPQQPPSQQVDPAQAEAVFAENQRLRTLLQQKELFAQRQSTALGEARKQLRVREQELQEKIKATYLDDPLSAMKAKDELNDVNSQLAGLDNEEAAIHRERISADVVTRYVPQEYWNVQAMAEELISDGVDKGYVESFVKNPLRSAMPETLVHLAKRAAAMTHLREVVKVAKQFKTENENLKKEVERLKSGGHLKTLKKVINAAPTMNAGSSNVPESSEASVANLDLTRMSKAELDRLLEN